MKIFCFLISSVLIFSACKKNNNSCSPVLPQTEANSIATFCSMNSIAYTVDSNGIYYQVLDPGAGARPDENSVITAIYTTSLLNGQVIDSTHTVTPVTLPLNQFIEGWRIAIPYIQKGGHIKMVVPSYYAYGCVGVQNVVPPNSPLYFDVILKDVSQ